MSDSSASLSLFRRIIKWTAIGMFGVAALLILYWLVWLIGALLGFWGNIGY
ncbi:MAG TPA: hypothetical protein VFI03_08655 [Solirubrobacterales bacterium]|nr:hypothetical protein [Solirubrobacterales bacterium]